jgi:hypothetical protein
MPLGLSPEGDLSEGGGKMKHEEGETFRNYHSNVTISK